LPFPVVPGRVLAPDWRVWGLSFAQAQAWAAVGNWAVRGTNEGRSIPRSFSLHSHTESSLPVFGRAGTFFTSRALTSHTCSPAASSK
jgi:hypothetical protein